MRELNILVCLYELIHGRLNLGVKPLKSPVAQIIQFPASQSLFLLSELKTHLDSSSDLLTQFVIHVHYRRNEMEVKKHFHSRELLLDLR